MKLIEFASYCLDGTYLHIAQYDLEGWQYVNMTRIDIRNLSEEMQNRDVMFIESHPGFKRIDKENGIDVVMERGIAIVVDGD